jgi:hypothetical protein
LRPIKGEERRKIKMTELSIVQRENKIDINEKRNHTAKHHSSPRLTEK